MRVELFNDRPQLFARINCDTESAVGLSRYDISETRGKGVMRAVGRDPVPETQIAGPRLAGDRTQRTAAEQSAPERRGA